MSNFTNLCDIHDWMKESEGLMLIKKLMEFGALPKEGQYPCQKCGHIMILVERNNVADKFKWCCKKRKNNSFATTLFPFVPKHFLLEAI